MSRSVDLLASSAAMEVTEELDVELNQIVAEIHWAQGEVLKLYRELRIIDTTNLPPDDPAVRWLAALLTIDSSLDQAVELCKETKDTLALCVMLNGKRCMRLGLEGGTTPLPEEIQVPPPPSPAAAPQERPRRTRQEWTAQQIDTLIDLVTRGFNNHVVAEATGKTLDQVRAKIKNERKKGRLGRQT